MEPSSAPPGPPPPPHIFSRTRWGPYTAARDFNVNMATVLLSLLAAAVIAFFIVGLLRLLHRLGDQPQHATTTAAAAVSGGAAATGGRGRGRGAAAPKPPSLADSLPSLPFSPSSTRLAGTALECAICLSEFAAGDRIKALPACNHGFHAECVDCWLASQQSCPTCRNTLRPAAAPAARR